jgi:hypothetical protein
MEERSVMVQAISVTVPPEDRKQPEAISRSHSLPHGIVRRAKIFLGSAGGMAATELAHRHQVSRPTVTLWRKRWRENGIAGLHPGRLCTIDDEHVPS